MNGINGDLTFMSLPDLMQWAETSRKTGTLKIRGQNVAKMFYLQDGKIIFVSSQKEGERLGEFFAKMGQIEPSRVEAALRESQKLGTPFTGFLISQGLIDEPTLRKIIEMLAERIFADALGWEEGTFEFSDSLPSVIQDGPIKLHTSFVVFQSVKAYDESRRRDVPGAEEILRELSKQITEGKIDIPPVPDMMQRLHAVLQREDTSIQEIVKIIMSDQILTSKILRVVNSAYYSPMSEITSLQQAIVFMGLKSILSIVTVHTLTSMQTGHADKIKEILRHSLMCSFIAKRIAGTLSLDPEEAFVCGLLHDIGKTVLTNLLAGKALQDETRIKLIDDYHAGVGYMVATKWNFSEVVRNSIKYHHSPGEAPSYRNAVEAVYVANIIANGKDVLEALPENCSTLDYDRISAVLQELEMIQNTVAAIIA